MVINLNSGIIRRLRQRFGFDRSADMFNRIRFRLTLTYSGILMLFLLLFTMIVVAVLFFIISRDQIAELQTQTDQQLAAYRDHTELPITDTRFFSYVVNAQGQVQPLHQTAPFFQQPVLQEIQGWVPQNDEIRYASVQLHHDRDLNLMLAGRVINENDPSAGILYTGFDVTYYWNIFTRLIEILVALSIVFIIIAAAVGHLMSKRAMTPIKNSFVRQREFVADASHELRTPLSVFQSSLDVIHMEEADTLSSYSRAVLQDMKDEVRSMTKLVSDLLTLARSDSGETDIQRQFIELVPIAEKVVRSLQPLAISNHIDLRSNLPETLTITGDQDRIKQLLYILLDNAIKYTPADGTVTLSLAVEKVGQQELCVIRVKDTGIGVPEEQQSQIFERFYRIDKNRSRQMGGTGLGLAIAKWITESHNGTIGLESKPGVGSTFTVSLPVTAK